MRTRRVTYSQAPTLASGNSNPHALRGPHDITRHRVSLVTSTPTMPDIADLDELDRQLASLFEGDDPAEVYAEIVRAFERMRDDQIKT